MKVAEPGGAARMGVSIAWSPGPRQVRIMHLQLPAGSTVAQALAAAGKTLDDVQAVSVWSRRARPDQVLEDGDRIELNRPLRVDPKRARRERFARQGSRMAGLFDERRPKGKPGDGNVPGRSGR